MFRSAGLGKWLPQLTAMAALSFQPWRRDFYFSNVEATAFYSARSFFCQTIQTIKFAERLKLLGAMTTVGSSGYKSTLVDALSVIERDHRVRYCIFAASHWSDGLNA